MTVNAIAPSMVPTEGLLARSEDDREMTNEEQVTLVSSMQTIKRRSVPTDLANALAFLVSDDADFITARSSTSMEG